MNLEADSGLAAAEEVSAEIQRAAPAVETPERLRLIEIAEWLERGGEKHKGIDRFRMSSYVSVEPECGTSCCIAGAAVAFSTPMSLYSSQVQIRARELLGLSSRQAHCLFHATDLVYEFTTNETESYGEMFLFSTVSPAWAARVIRDFLATGRISWSAHK